MYWSWQATDCVQIQNDTASNTYFLYADYLYFSDPPRHRAHGQVPHPGVRVPREGPQAVHGRLWRHPCNEQCQTFPLPGERWDYVIISFTVQILYQ